MEEVAVEAGEGEGATQDQEAVVDAPEAGKYSQGHLIV